MNINRILFVALVALGLSACHKNNPDFLMKGDEIHVTAGVQGQATRAGYDAESLPATFYLTFIQDEKDLESEYNYLNAKMVKGEGSEYATASGTALVWKEKDHSYVKANAYTTEGDVFSVLENQTSEADLKNSDLLGAAGNDVTVDGNNLNINLHHMLCKLDITFIWDEALADVDKELASVVYSGFGEDVSLDRDNAVVTAGTRTADIHACLSVVDAKKTSISEAVFAPQTSDIAILIKANVANSAKEYKLNLMPPTDGFVLGNSYSMTVKISKEVVYFEASPTLQDWEVENQLNFTERKEPTFIFSATTESPSESNQ